MKTNFRILITLSLGILLLLIYACEKDTIEDNQITKEKVSGLVQKGPFINGTQILMADLNSSMKQIGKIFSTQITNDYGAFEVHEVVLSSSYVEFSAAGYYFNEVSGKISSAPLTLFALSDVSDINSVNINILTHLEKQRVEYLITEHNNKFAEAKKTAQSEILSMFGYHEEDMSGSETLTIQSDNQSNAILLAISVILQGNRSVGTLTELLANISNDLKEDGIMSDEKILDSLRTTTLALDLNTIRKNLVDRFQSLGVGATIADFESYVNSFLSFTAQQPIGITSPADNIQTHSATLQAGIQPNSSPTQVSFEYGTTTDYGLTVTATQSPLSGNTYQMASAVIEELEPGTSYHCRVVAENEQGLVYGIDREFTTLGAVPTTILLDPSKITTTTASLNATVNPNDLNTVVNFEYGESISYGNSAVASQSPLTGNSNQNVNVDISDLEPGIVYHYRIIAENELGVSYGEDATFTTTFTGIIGSVADVDGNLYSTIGIGYQIWMAENLKATQSVDGNLIPLVTLNTEWETLGESDLAYCFFENNKDNEYGAYYTFSAATGIQGETILASGNIQGVCPSGWHIPRKEEYYELVNFISSDEQISNLAQALKATSGWPSETNGTDDYGFSSVPTGLRVNGEGFSDTDNALLWGIEYVNETVYPSIFSISSSDIVENEGYNPNSYGVPVRCVKD